MNINLLRNIGIIAHVDAGKTTLTERILFTSGQTHSIGEPHSGNAKTDFDPDEQKKGITISSAAVSVYWNKHRISIIDTPGHIDFNIEVNRALRVLDGAVVVFDGVAGVEPQSETNWHLADQYGVPRICFVNKLDRAGADFFRVVDMIESRLGVNALITQIPIGTEENFVGLVDLINMYALYWDQDKAIMQFRIAAIPEQLIESAKKYRQNLFDTLMEYDENIMQSYLSNDAVDVDTIKHAIRSATLTSACP